MGRQKKPPALLSAVSTTYSGPTASSLSYGQGTAVEPNGGHRFTAASTGLSGGGVIVIVYTWLDPQRMSYGFGYGFLGPSPDSSMSWGGTPSSSFRLVAEPAAGRHSARHIVHNIRSGGRFHQGLALFVAIVLHSHTYIQQACPCCS